MADRQLDLDFAKGLLVALMVVYHTMNYFASIDAAYYGYLRFVNGSFVFLAGYTVALFYAPQDQRPRTAVSGRLLTRGAKLLAIFTVLNLAILLLGVTSYRKVDPAGADLAGSIVAMYGTGHSDRMAFRILAPIAYVLLLAPIYLGARRLRQLLILMTIVAAACLPWGGLEAPHLFFLLTGLVGLSMGLLLAGRSLPPIRSLPLIAVGFLALAAAMNTLSGNVLAYSIGIALMLKLILDFAGAIDLQQPLTRVIRLMGRYSLPCYIVQIGLLFVLYKLLPGQRWPLGGQLLLIVAAINALLVAMCWGLARARREYRWAEKTYAFVFA
ncbi:MAG TPA: OpgC domain-containing protein [Ideonella sp.]|nr:OpgC domain-containing protein [Ideonella sp.]